MSLTRRGGSSAVCKPSPSHSPSAHSLRDHHPIISRNILSILVVTEQPDRATAAESEAKCVLQVCTRHQVSLATGQIATTESRRRRATARMKSLLSIAIQKHNQHKNTPPSTKRLRTQKSPDKEIPCACAQRDVSKERTSAVPFQIAPRMDYPAHRRHGRMRVTSCVFVR